MIPTCIRTYGLFFLLCLAVVGEGCTDNGTPLDPGVALISGSWAWQRSEGFPTQGIVPPSRDYVILPQPGFSFIIRFDISREYSEKVKGVIELHARYELEPEGNYYRVKYSGMMLTNGGVRDRG